VFWLILSLKREREDAGILEATVMWCKPLFFKARDGKNHEHPMTKFVTSASSMQWLPGWEGKKLVVIQDNANYISTVDISTIEEGIDNTFITPPRGYKNRIYFPDDQKFYKNDFEASAYVNLNGINTFIIFGSGSGYLQYRQKVVLVTQNQFNFEWETNLYDAKEFYLNLEKNKNFSGTELNLEGAIIHNSTNGHLYIRLFQRGNGAPRHGTTPVDASCDVNLHLFLEYLLQENTKKKNHEIKENENDVNGDPIPLGENTQVPEKKETTKKLETNAKTEIPDMENIIQYNLGKTEENVKLTFTDVVIIPSGSAILYISAAENSADSYTDGPVMGAAIGVYPNLSTTQGTWQFITDKEGNIAKIKPEGVALDPSLEFVYILLDKDTSDAPSDLCQVKLKGNWFNS